MLGRLAAHIVLALATITTTQVAYASITYDLSPIIDTQGDTIAGTIVTDGNQGTLVGADILSWSVEIVGPAENSSFNSGQTWSALCFSCGLAATGNAVYFDFGSRGLNAYSLNTSNAYLLFQSEGPLSQTGSIAWNIGQSSGSINVQGNQIIATAAVPEPTDAALLASGLVAIAGITHRRQARKKR